MKMFFQILAIPFVGCAWPVGYVAGAIWYGLKMAFDAAVGILDEIGE